MAFWSGETIRGRGQGTPPIIEPFDEKWIDCNAYTLHMGREVFLTPHRQMPDRYARSKHILNEGDSFSIPAGQFAFLLSKEILHMPNNIMAFTSLRSRIKWRGLVNVSGFHVDPGFNGHFLYAVYNAGPSLITLFEGESLFLMWFAEIDCKTTEFYRRDREPLQTIESSVIQPVSGHVLSMQDLSKEMSELRNSLFKIQAGVAIGVVILGLLFAALAVPWNEVLPWFFGSAHHPVPTQT